MNYSEKFRNIWWVITVILFSIFSSFFLYIRWESIKTGMATPFDIAVIGIFVVIWLLPLISEISILGTSVKRYVDEKKEEIDKQSKEVKALSDGLKSLIHDFAVSTLRNQVHSISSPPEHVITADNIVQLCKKHEIQSPELDKALDDFKFKYAQRKLNQIRDSVWPSQGQVLDQNSILEIKNQLVPNEGELPSPEFVRAKIGNLLDDKTSQISVLFLEYETFVKTHPSSPHPGW